MRLPKYRPPSTPGQILKSQFLIPMNLTQVQFAKMSGLSIRALNEICTGKRAVTARTSIMISNALGTTPELWIDLQTAFDLWHEMQKFKNKKAG